MVDDYTAETTSLRARIRALKQTEDQMRGERQTLEQELRMLIARNMMTPNPL